MSQLACRHCPAAPLQRAHHHIPAIGGALPWLRLRRAWRGELREEEEAKGELGGEEALL